MQPDETQRLLSSQDGGDDELSVSHRTGLLSRFSALTTEPTTALSRLLLALCLALLLLLSIFVGLFAGLQHRISLGGDPDKRPHTTTSIITTTRDASTTHITTTSTTTVTFIPPQPSIPSYEKPCMSTDCIVVAGSIIASLDPAADPCDDFYRFANGGWLDSHPVPLDRASTSVADEAARRNKQTLQHLLRTLRSADPADQISLRKMRRLLDSCMDASALDTAGIAPLLEVLRRVKQLCKSELRPASNPSGAIAPQDVTHDYTAVLAYLHSLDVNALFSFVIGPDVGSASVESDLNVLWLMQPRLDALPRAGYDDREIAQEYKSAIQSLLYVTNDEEYDGEPSVAWPPWPWPPQDPPKRENRTERAERLAKGVFEFEKSLAFIQGNSSPEDPDTLYNPVPLSDLSDAFPSVSFPAYLSSFAPRAFANRIITSHPQYLSDLASLIAMTASDIIESYLMLRTIWELAPNLGQQTSVQRIIQQLRSKTKRPRANQASSRHDFCLSTVEKVFGFALGRFFVAETLGNDTVQNATRIVNDLIRAYNSSLPALDWMDGTTTTSALEKASDLRLKIGYPTAFPNISSASNVARYYSALEIGPSFFEAMLTSRYMGLARAWRSVGQARNSQEWDRYPTTFESDYLPLANEFVLPAGAIRSHLFSKNWPGYLSYGSLGTAIAHKLSYAFHGGGQFFDRHGKLDSWWTNRTRESFSERQRCLAHQQAEYHRPNVSDSTQTAKNELLEAESIADAAVVVAHRAWTAQFNSSLHRGNEYLLPGLNYTQEQLFFVAFAQTFAKNQVPAVKWQTRNGTHSSSKGRVERALLNIPEFAAAFNCPSGSKMNLPAERRCSAW